MEQTYETLTLISSRKTMASFLSKFLASIVLLWSFLPSTALDMLSIVTYDQLHLMGSIPLSDDELRGMYGSWLARYRKSYDAAGEADRRFEIFKANLKFVSLFNSFERPYKVGLNRFADLTNEEYRQKFLEARVNRDRRLSRPRYTGRYRVGSGEELPESVDWREKGAVAPVKDQGLSGNGWVFSTVAAVEGVNKIVTGNMTILSEQDLPDCDVASSHGCDKFVSENNNTKIVSIDGYESVRTNDELALKKAVAYQPVRVAIEASEISFQLYQKGVYNGGCGVHLDHGVVIVGYGSEKGQEFWTVKNSWGTDWGEEGYVRLERNHPVKHGKCGVAMEASYPVEMGPTLSGRRRRGILN